jgi:Gram-negative bacterial TonB protein C-terminal
MTERRLVFRTAVVGVFVIFVLPGVIWAQESIQVAQTLYASASYDEALALLDRLQGQQLPPEDVRSVQQSRALCLLALGRSQDAEVAIAAVVNTDPLYRPDESTASPRVRTAFRAVRMRLLPGIIKSRYIAARGLYDEQRWPDAVSVLREVQALAADQDLTDEQRKEVAEYKVLADGFLKLAETAAAPPPTPEPPPAAALAPPVVDYERVFDSTDAAVTPPATIKQEMPRWLKGGLPLPGPGTIEVIISKTGMIERATITQSMVTFYDRQVLDATKSWRYHPAQLDGRPVRYKKQIRVTFQ